MNKHERYLILTKAYSSRRNGRLPPVLRPDSGFVVLRSASAKLYARRPEKISHRGRPNRFCNSERLLPRRGADESTPAAPIVPRAVKKPGRPSRVRPGSVLYDPDSPLSDVNAFFSQMLSSGEPLCYDEPLLITADAVGAFGAQPDPALIQALSLQFDRFLEFVLPGCPRCRLEGPVFAACLPKRLVSAALLGALTRIPVRLGAEITDVPLRVLAVSPDGEPVRRYELRAFTPHCRTKLSGCDFFTHCSFETRYSPALDALTGCEVLDEALPYLVFPGGIVGSAQIAPMLICQGLFFRDFFALAGRQLFERITRPDMSGSPPVSLRLSPAFFTPDRLQDTLDMLSRAAELCQSRLVSQELLLLEMSSSAVAVSKDILERGFRTVIYDYPPRGLTLSPFTLDRTGVAAVKINAGRLFPDASVSRMLMEYELCGVDVIIEGALTGAQREEWLAVGAHIFQSR